MGDTTDGSSNAAQSAQETDTSSDRGFFGRIMDALASPETNGTEADGSVSDTAQPVAGMVNLRRMRVEDVAIPTADITNSRSILYEGFNPFKSLGNNRFGSTPECFAGSQHGATYKK